MANSFIAISMLLSLLSFNTFASIAPIAPKLNSNTINSQMVNLNMQFKANNKTLKSDLSMPFYQVAELEKKFNNKNYLIKVNPRRGKNLNEVEIELKFFHSNSEKAFAKKEIIAVLGEESKVSVKGVSVKITPVLN